MEKNELYQKAIDKWGKEEQLKMVAEECLELALAIRHNLRGKTTTADIIEEAADVEIMLEQLREIMRGYLGSHGEVLIDEKKAEKLERLERLLEEEI
ncbi:nucleoside triphosphate pyrophosphohydrolase family protein [Orenia marismortui]|uniref:hypothetical protein n=1 Tax=Orenia marismortui TaxID=46469 RepID=UPI000366BCAA|nr:hypothetical protein [Orenia marismortui]